MVQKVNSVDEFKELLNDESTPLVVDCYADWCPPCKVSSPQFEAMSKKYDQARWVKVNVDEQPEIAGAFQVHAIPSFFVMRGKTLLGAVVGADTKKLEKIVEKALSSPTPIVS